jgi:hypothetical protein
LLPLTLGSGGGPCDEIVGRFCTWYGEGEWVPAPEPDELRHRRATFLAGMDSLQSLLPADEWVLGQRVWYRGEGGDWKAALATARRCGEAPAWWCSALEGLALHGLQRYPDAERAFGRALREMDPELALEWRVPDRAVDSDAREILAAGVTAAGESLELVLARFWSLSDPLYLVAGNDRMTAHYARWTVATLRDGARNPYRVRWGRDLEELTVRYGWEVGWERSWGSRPGAAEEITGHKEHEGRDYLPGGTALADPTRAASGEFVAHRARPRSSYAPPYAPVLLPMDAQIALFPRGERVVVAATHFLPEDTTYHARHDHPRPWMDAGEQADMPDRIGLFALPVDGGEPMDAERVGSASGALMIDLPVGAWVISAESWSPAERRAGRYRIGFDRAPSAPGVAVLSDILLLAPSESTPHALEEALPSALPTPEIARDARRLGLAWEVSGLGARDGSLRFQVSVERTGRGVVRRIGEFLGLTTRPATVAVSWGEAGPGVPHALFRHLDLALPSLAPGTYAVTLTLSTSGRSDVVSRRAFRVR